MSRGWYVSAFMPSANGQHAGARVAFENLSCLCDAYGTVDALTCTAEKTAQPAPDAVHVIRHHALDLLRYASRQPGSLGLRTAICGPLMHTRLNAEADRWLMDRLHKFACDEVFVDFTRAVLLVQRSLRTPRLTSLLFAGVVLREEKALVDSATLVLTLNNKDRSLVKSLYVPPRGDVKPFASPGWCAAVERRSDRIDAGMLLFFGNFNRPENQLAAQWFLQHAWDAVAHAVPGLSLKLAQQFDPPHASGTGFIPDTSAWFSRCAVASTPLLHGARVKFKLFEALACGVPVVGTPVACEGIEDQPLLTRATPAEFSDRSSRRSPAPKTRRPAALLRPIARRGSRALLSPLVTNSAGEVEDALSHNLSLPNLLWRRMLRCHETATDATSSRESGIASTGWPAFLLARSNAFAALEGFDERYSFYCEDFDLSARAFNAGYAPVHVPNARVIHNAPARQPPLVAPPSTACEQSVEGLVLIGNLGGRALGSAHPAHAQAADGRETLIAT